MEAPSAFTKRWDIHDDDLSIVIGVHTVARYLRSAYESGLCAFQTF
jgi:hypothetical protein